MMQHFHWYSSENGDLWQESGEKAEALAKIGITSL